MTAMFPLLKRVLPAALVIACSSGLAAAATPAMVFEDRNDNGVFDGSDVNVTQTLLDVVWFETSHSIVVTPGVLKARDPHWGQTGDSGGIYIHSAKKITVLGSLLAEYHTCQVTLWADDTIRIGSNVTLSASDFVSVQASNGLVMGDKVKLKSTAGSDNMTIIKVSNQAGDVTIGSGFVATARKEITIHSFGGKLTFGSGSQVSSSKEYVSILAATSLTMDGAKITSSQDVDIFAGNGSLSLRTGKVSAKSGGITIMAPQGTAILSGTKFKPFPSVTAQSVTW